jgi:lipoate-protein ligase B
MGQEEQMIWDARWLGTVDYDAAWQLQERLAGEIAAGQRPPTLLLLEHPHVFTLGRRGQASNVLWDASEREQRGVILRDVDRGGDVTYHGPGQLVGYPLLPLAPKGWAGADSQQTRIPQADYVGYVRKLEKTLITALARLGVVAGQRAGLTGVWVAADVWARCPRCDPRLKPQPAKIASIGVKVDVHGVSRHGFALNVATDPLYWEGIIPCGLDQVQMANLADLLDPPPGMERVREAVLWAFEDVFGCRLRRLEGLDDLAGDQEKDLL